MEKLIAKLQAAYPEISFKKSETAKWSPKDKQVHYPEVDSDNSTWSTLHELGHALMEHSNYCSDIDLLNKETEAWEKAVEISKNFGINICNDHIQNCLDTYRDWIHKRSTCPSCTKHGIQTTENAYSCLNCGCEWSVSPARFCRPYRLKTIKQ